MSSGNDSECRLQWMLQKQFITRVYDFVTTANSRACNRKSFSPIFSEFSRFASFGDENDFTTTDPDKPTSFDNCIFDNWRVCIPKPKVLARYKITLVEKKVTEACCSKAHLWVCCCYTIVFELMRYVARPGAGFKVSFHIKFRVKLTENIGYVIDHFRRGYIEM